VPKVKTNKSAAKRFKITGKGKVKRMRAFLTKKSAKRKRKLRKAVIASPGDSRRVLRMLRRQ
jgi:large subunit ribosomal protein L35